MQRTIVIGDVHGCYDEVIDLFDLLRIDVTKDRVIFAGDLLDRGPKPVECLDLAMQFEAVLGNHEERHIKERRRGRDPVKMLEHHRRTFESIRPQHWHWLESLPLYIELPEHNAVVVHAGVIPDVPLRLQDPHFLLHGQMVIPPTNRWGYWAPTGDTWWPSKAPPEAKFWAELYTGPAKVIFGHTVFSDVLKTEHCVGIDTGCVFGDRLTALVLPEWETVSVPARNNYWPSRAKTFEILGVRAFC